MDSMEDNPDIREAVHDAFLAGDLSFLMHDTQLSMRDMVEQGGDEILIFSSRQLGKSFFDICLAIEHCIKHNRPMVRIFADTLEQVNDIVADNISLIEQLAPPGFITRRKSDKRWMVGNGEIRLGPLAQAHIDGKRGGNATLIILEEGCFVSSDEYKAAIGSVIGPQLLRSGGKLVHVTSPSKDMQHYVHTTVLPKCEATGSVARYTVYDNPQLTQEQIDKAKSRCTSNEEWLREYMAEIIRDDTTTAIPEFDETRHVVEREKPSHAYWLVSLDFGGTVDKHGLVLCYYDFEIAKFRVWDERLLNRNTSTKVIRETSIDMEKQAKWLDEEPNRVSDSPGQITIDLRCEDFFVRPPKKGKGSWEADQNALRLAFTRDEIEIEPRCKWLIATLKYGQFTDSRKDWRRTEELGHLDLLAALMYGYRARDLNNPFPRHMGKSIHTHHISREEQESADTLQNVFFTHLK